MTPTLFVGRAGAPPRTSGRRWTMAAPRARFGEWGDGCVPLVVPPLDWVRAARIGALTLVEYQARYEARLRAWGAALRPGRLMAHLGGDRTAKVLVRGGDTLLCACATSQANLGRCHRFWLASLLQEAGWRVVRDGQVHRPVVLQLPLFGEVTP